MFKPSRQGGNMTDSSPRQGETSSSQGSALSLLPRRVIHRQLLLDTVQEKSVLLPLAASLMGLLYLLLFAPGLGGELLAGIISLAATAFWAGNLLWRVGIRYQQGYTRKLHELASQIEAESMQRIESQLQQMKLRLEQGFEGLQLTEGSSILGGLDREYRHLLPLLERASEAGQLSTIQLGSLVRETYIQGLNVLEHVLELESALGTNMGGDLLAEIERLEQKAGAAAQDPESIENLDLIQEKVSFHKERLNREKKLRIRVEQLIYQADRCKVTLSETHIELAVLKADSSDASISSVIDALLKTIERAKEVQAELKKMGF
jgi:hypothetical protein